MVFELLSDAEMCMYELRIELMALLSPDTAEERFIEKMNCRKFVEGRESIRQMALYI